MQAKIIAINVIAKSIWCSFFITPECFSKWKRLSSLNLSGTYQGEDFTRPPSGTTPGQSTVHDNEDYGSFFIGSTGLPIKRNGVKG